MSDPVTKILLLIVRLTAAQLVELNERLRLDPPPDSGVREPRRPRPPTRGSAA